MNPSIGGAVWAPSVLRIWKLRKAGDGAGDDGWSGSYPRVGYRLPCLRLGAFLVL